SYRERLKNANGTFANDVLLLASTTNLPTVEDYAMQKMDEWLTALNKDASGDPILKKILRAKPTDLVDSCWSPTDERVIEPQTFTGGKCNTFYPTMPSPRMIAGGPLASNVLKCQLKPVDMQDYKVPFSADERARLMRMFSEGVCDWTRPGVGQQPNLGT